MTINMYYMLGISLLFTQPMLIVNMIEVIGNISSVATFLCELSHKNLDPWPFIIPAEQITFQL